MLDFVLKIWKIDLNYLLIVEFFVVDFFVLVWIVVNMDIIKRLIVLWCIYMENFLNLIISRCIFLYVF